MGRCFALGHVSVYGRMLWCRLEDALVKMGDVLVKMGGCFGEDGKMVR